MIRLTKGASPQLLLNRAAQWTAELLTEIADGSDKVAYRKSKYNQPEIKDAVKAETFNKCAYCESDPLHVTYGDIEHIIPKASQPELTFEWSNLTLACDRCNTKKGDIDGLLDPFNCDPSEHFTFFGPMILHNEGSRIAETTRTVLDLDRVELINKRRERLEALTNRLRLINQHPENDERTLLIKVTVEHEAADEREYAACARDHLRNLGYLQN